jgi:CRP-like cAMP-binding protein
MKTPFESPLCAACATRAKSVFKNVEGEALDNMSTSKTCNVFAKGDTVFRVGERPGGLYCIHHGKIKVFKTGDEGRDHIVRFAKSGDVIGYRALISGEAYSSSAAALEESVVCRIPVETFYDLLRADGGFSLEMIHLLSRDLRRAESRLLNLAQKPVRERLAEALLILKEVYGTENGDSSAIGVTLSRDELASVVGTATETLVRTISDFKRENLIATDKKKIRILDVQGLIRAGNLQD